jgi:hypothetical protein
MSSSNTNRAFLLKLRHSRIEQDQFTGSYGGDTYNRYNYCCVTTYFLSVVIMMSKSVVPSVVEQGFNVKFITTANVKPADIQVRLRAQFDEKRSPGV